MELNLEVLKELKEQKNTSEEQTQPERQAKIDSLGRSYGTGRRKDAAARVWIKKGTGKFVINSRNIEDYFPRKTLRMIVNRVFVDTETAGQFDVFCTVKGGGTSGQAGAILHGIARALDNYHPHLHKNLRAGGFLTRDSRTVERKKPGRAKARKKFQFSKR